MSLSHLHPMMAHFPIILIIIGFLTDIIALFFQKEGFFQKAGFYLLIIGTLSALVAVLSGSFFTEEMIGAVGEIRELHEHLAYTSLGFLVATSILRIFLKIKNKENSALNWLVFLMYGFSVLLLCFTGFYGGMLVFNFMIPVQ